MKNVIGFMQGRLSELVDEKIQAFPAENWENEFVEAKKLQIPVMEWTIDYKGLYQNPLMYASGRTKIKELKKTYGIEVLSLTGDCFMQKPFWKNKNSFQEKLQDDFLAVVEASAALGINIIVLPLVDSGSIELDSQERDLVDFLNSKSKFLERASVRIAFESDFAPLRLKEFISKFSNNVFGINYDTGNSASMGFDVEEEFSAYADRIINVHIKDRAYKGSTVPLGAGSVNFEKVFSELANIRYGGAFILQTARSKSGDHVGAIEAYFSFVSNYLGQFSTDHFNGSLEIE